MDSSAQSFGEIGASGTFTGTNWSIERFINLSGSKLEKGKLSHQIAK
jgi:hypothetical protein